MNPNSALPEGFAIRQIEGLTQLYACWPVMQQLRPHLKSAQDMTDRVLRMQESGYRILAVWQDEEIIALAGYRISENLIYGRFLYVDDLVTREDRRGGEWGARLLEEASSIGEKSGCARLVLDTGLVNSLAQRFYFRQGLLTGAMGFSKVLKGSSR